MESVESVQQKTATPKQRFDARKQQNVDKLEITVALKKNN